MLGHSRYVELLETDAPTQTTITVVEHPGSRKSTTLPCSPVAAPHTSYACTLASAIY